MSSSRSILGIWVIERDSGRNLVARAYDGVTVDMDLIAPFLSATHTFIDKASNETLKTIDTESNRYVWEANEHLLFVMVVSKAARIGHMRFVLQYALAEFMNAFLPEGETVDRVLSEWHGSPDTFQEFGEFVDELISQYETTDDLLITGKSMDCLEVYSHVFREIMRVEADQKTIKKLVERIKSEVKPLKKKYSFLKDMNISTFGVCVLEIDVVNGNIPYRNLRNALEEILRVTAKATMKTLDSAAYRNMIFDHLMPYVKRDIKRLQTYAILDDVVRYLF